MVICIKVFAGASHRVGFFDKLNRVGYRCLSKFLPRCSCNGGEVSTKVDCWICCGGRAASGSSSVGWIGAGAVLCGMSGQKMFSNAWMASNCLSPTGCSGVCR